MQVQRLQNNFNDKTSIYGFPLKATTLRGPQNQQIIKSNKESLDSFTKYILEISVIHLTECERRFAVRRKISDFFSPSNFLQTISVEGKKRLLFGRVMKLIVHAISGYLYSD